MIGAGSVLGAFAFFAPGAVAGARMQLGPGACVGPESNLGADVVMHAHAAVKHCDVGDGAVLHQHASAGDDGFGFFVDENEATRVKCVKKKPQTLRVNVGARCEIGAGSRVDRGSWRDTVLGSNTKLDNLVHVGHNARIGANVLLCGGCGDRGQRGGWRFRRDGREKRRARPRFDLRRRENSRKGWRDARHFNAGGLRGVPRGAGGAMAPRRGETKHDGVDS
jgi:carbonic anhydrase/acetyltransferase-like protein (isoleucine patch superfamily)